MGGRFALCAVRLTAHRALCVPAPWPVPARARACVCVLVCCWYARALSLLCQLADCCAQDVYRSLTGSHTVLICDWSAVFSSATGSAGNVGGDLHCAHGLRDRTPSALCLCLYECACVCMFVVRRLLCRFAVARYRSFPLALRYAHTEPHSPYLPAGQQSLALRVCICSWGCE